MSELQNEEAQDVAVAEASEAPLWYWGTGRRKASISRVRIRPGTGKIVVNKKPIEDFFRVMRNRGKAVLPLKATKMEGKVDVYANCSGGGITGQSEAMLMGLARALVEFDEGTEPALRASGYLTRDARKVERKKYGQSGARRRYQYSKR